MDQLFLDSQAMGTGAFARTRALRTGDSLLSGRELRIVADGFLFDPVVLIIHRVAEDVIHRDLVGARGKAFFTAYAAVEMLRLFLVTGDELQ